MPCCGQIIHLLPKNGKPGKVEPRDRQAHATIKFQYTGKTGLTVIGPITGMQYRFDGPGAILPVDARDHRAVAAVPNLRRVP
jgi:hypothetical protein